MQIEVARKDFHEISFTCSVFYVFCFVLIKHISFIKNSSTVN